MLKKHNTLLQRDISKLEDGGKIKGWLKKISDFKLELDNLDAINGGLKKSLNDMK